MMFNGLEIEWLGHAGFLIEASKVIYIDPFRISVGEPKADIILITHTHYDHCSIADIDRIVKDGTAVVVPADCQSKITKLKQKIDLIVIEPGQSRDLNGIKIKAVPAYNIDKEFHDKHEFWNGYVVEIDGKRIYHSGDTDLVPEMSEINDIDIALLPVGGTYTMDAKQASQAALLIKPKLAVPMHWGVIVGTKEDAFRFSELCEQEGVDVKILEKK